MTCYCAVASKHSGDSTFHELGFSSCANCGAVFRNPMPTEEELSDIYRACYSHSSIVSGATDQLSPDDAYTEIIRIVKKYAAPNSAILDVGAGTGGLVSLLNTMYSDVDGVESSDEARAFADQTNGVKLFHSMSQITRKSYDLITLVEVIEHVTDPIDFLRDVIKLLKPGGFLIITTPNRDGLRARLEGRRWAEAVKLFHLHLFNKRSLDYCLSAAGFRGSEVIGPQYDFYRPIDSLLAVFLWIFRINGSLRVVVKC